MSSCGYVIEMFKYPQMDSERGAYYRKGLSLSPDNSMVTFGDFDRTSFHRITDFNEFNTAPLNTRCKGKTQSVLIYDINTPVFAYTEGDTSGDYGFRSTIDGGFINKKFAMITMMSLSNELKQIVSDRNKLFCSIKREVQKIAKSMPFQHLITVDTFGCLATPEICLVCLADQYVDSLHFASLISRACVSIEDELHPVFAHAHSTIMLCPYPDATAQVRDIDYTHTEGYAYVHLTLRKNECTKSAIDELSNCLLHDGSLTSVIPEVGEFDFQFKTTVQDAIHAVTQHADQSYGILHYNSPFYSNNILQTNISLTGTKNDFFDITPPRFTLDGTAIGTSPKRVELLSSINSLESDINHAFSRLLSVYTKNPSDISSSVGFVNNLHWLKHDFSSNIEDTYDDMWRADLSYQFKHILLTLASLKESNSTIPLDVFCDSRELIRAFQTQIHHVSQSFYLKHEAPDGQLLYTGKMDTTIKSFYGLIKKFSLSAIKTEQRNMLKLFPCSILDRLLMF